MAFRRTGGRLPDVRSESCNHEQLRGQGNASPDSSRGILHGNHERTVAIIADAAEAQHNHEDDKCSLGQDSGPRTTEIGTSRPRDLRRGRGRLRNRITACWRTRPSGLAATHGLRHLGLARARRDAPRASRERWAGLLNSGRGRGGPSPLPRWSRSAGARARTTGTRRLSGEAATPGGRGAKYRPGGGPPSTPGSLSTVRSDLCGRD